MNPRTSKAFFEDKYRSSADPWDFASSAYERGRYASILAELGGRRFRFAVEPGCSIGVLTAELARICDRVQAFDVSESAAAIARGRCSGLPHVRVLCMPLQEAHALHADLLVFSEIGYYFEAAPLAAIWQRLVDELSEDATVLACHWLGQSADHVLAGDEVHEILGEARDLHHRHSERHSAYRLDVWCKSRSSL